MVSSTAMLLARTGCKAPLSVLTNSESLPKNGRYGLSSSTPGAASRRVVATQPRATFDARS